MRAGLGEKNDIVCCIETKNIYNYLLQVEN